MADPRPSVTAAVVASTLLLLRDDPLLGPLVDRNAHDAIEASVRATVPLFGQLLDRVPWPVLRRASHGVERLVSPGFIAHYALRKHAVRTELQRAVREGFRQVVLLGAGFDMLSTSVPEGATVFEVDLPATQDAKRGAMQDPRAHPVSFVAVDLGAESLREVLHVTPGFDAGASTVFVAEGLLMYLPPARVEALLADVARSTSADVRAVFSILTPDRAGRPRIHSQRKLVDLCMRWLDEPFVWGASREGVARLFAAHGLELESALCTTEMRDRLLGEEGRRRMPKASGELVVVGTSRRSPAIA